MRSSVTRQLRLKAGDLCLRFHAVKRILPDGCKTIPQVPSDLELMSGFHPLTLHRLVATFPPFLIPWRETLPRGLY